MIFCPSCGKKISSSSKFCKYCGYQMGTASPVSRRKPLLKKLHLTKKKVIVIVAFVLIVVVGGCGYKYYSSHVLPHGIANQTITLSNDYSKATYHIHGRSFSIKYNDGTPSEKYDVESISKNGHRVKAIVQGLNKHSNASSYTFDDYGNELSAQPHF